MDIRFEQQNQYPMGQFSGCQLATALPAVPLALTQLPCASVDYAASAQLLRPAWATAVPHGHEPQLHLSGFVSPTLQVSAYAPPPNQIFLPAIANCLNPPCHGLMFTQPATTAPVVPLTLQSRPACADPPVISIAPAAAVPVTESVVEMPKLLSAVYSPMTPVTSIVQAAVRSVSSLVIPAVQVAGLIVAEISATAGLVSFVIRQAPIAFKSIVVVLNDFLHKLWRRIFHKSSYGPLVSLVQRLRKPGFISKLVVLQDTWFVFHGFHPPDEASHVFTLGLLKTSGGFATA